jgi:lysozyme family protein
MATKKIPLTQQLRAEYQRLFDTCEIRPERLAEVDAEVKAIDRRRARYDAVSGSTGVPWHVIATLHALEGSLDFSTHLHNGDPLTARTVNKPAGRPPGVPPFTWEQSAADALAYDGLTQWDDWSLPGTLYRFENYNGWGYRLYHAEILSPYLWSYCTHYVRGKFRSDGEWDPKLVSKQSGAAVILRRMAELGIIDPSRSIPAHAGVTDEHLRNLQRTLSSMPNIYVPIDGRLNAQTVHAVGALIPRLRQRSSRRNRRSK